jgi:hypothetical protein
MLEKLSHLNFTLIDMKALVIESVMKMRRGDFDRLNRTIANLAATRGIAEPPVSTDLTRRYGGTVQRHRLNGLGE